MRGGGDGARAAEGVGVEAVDVVVVIARCCATDSASPAENTEKTMGTASTVVAKTDDTNSHDAPSDNNYWFDTPDDNNYSYDTW